MRHENTPDIWDTAPAEYFTEGGGPILYGEPRVEPETVERNLADLPKSHPLYCFVLSEIAQDGFSLIKHEGQYTYFTR